MINNAIYAVGVITCFIGAIIGVALLACLAGNVWMDASRKWRSIFHAESSILDYIQNRKEFKRWKETLKDGSTTDKN